MILIVGLGNPGDQYLDTRHNLGFEVLDHLVHKLASSQSIKPVWEYKERFKAEVIQTNYTLSTITHSLILAKPRTYMNNSGMTVSKFANFYKIKPENIIIIHDDLDLLLGKMKVRFGGGAGGHHGVESVINSLGTQDFVRIRLGIGTTTGFLGEHKRVSFNADKFVMEPFLPTERSKIKALIKHALKAVETILEKGLEKAQNQFN